MATNEDLAIAFLCLCDTKDKEDLLEVVKYHLMRWDNTENKERILDAIRLPTPFIQRKITLLHTGLHSCPQKQKIYEEMANRLGNLTASLRSPLLKPISEGFTDILVEHIMPISLYPQESTEKGTMSPK